MNILVFQYIFQGITPLWSFLKYDEEGYPIEEANYESFFSEDEEDDDFDGDDTLESENEWA
jgi:hypothetical protein